MNDLLERLPMTSQLDHSKQAKSSEGAHNASINCVLSYAEREVDQANNHYDAVKNVEPVKRIVLYAQSDYFHNHLDRKDPNEYDVEDFQNLRLAVTLVIAIKSQGNRIGKDEAVDKEVEGHGDHDLIEEPVDSI